MRPELLALQLDISLSKVDRGQRRLVGREEGVKGDVPRMKSCRVGKLSGWGLCLEELVNSISLGRCMILTVHNRELVLSRSKQSSCVFGLAKPEAG